MSHDLRFIGCMSKECNLCKNNPNKRCPEGDNLDECYADCQVLRSKCEAEVFVELVNTQTERPVALPGMEVQALLTTLIYDGIYSVYINKGGGAIRGGGKCVCARVGMQVEVWREGLVNVQIGRLMELLGREVQGDTVFGYTRFMWRKVGGI
eukprot:scaffold195383_cov26-Tisochrysis_lutea.AAC.1